MCGVGGCPSGSHRRCIIVRVAGAQDLWLGALALVNHQVDGHFTLQTRDVSVAEVVAQLVNLRAGEEKKQSGQISECRRRRWRRRERLVSGRRFPRVASPRFINELSHGSDNLTHGNSKKQQHRLQNRIRRSPGRGEKPASACVRSAKRRVRMRP